MKVIRNYSDFEIPIVVYGSDGLPINPHDASVLDISVYTTDVDAALVFDKDDIDVSTNTISIDGNDASILMNGALYYKYSLLIEDELYPDKNYSATKKVQTDIYIMNRPEKHKSACATMVSELINDADYITRMTAEPIIERAVEEKIGDEYPKRSEVEASINEVIEMIPSLDGYATEEYVNDKVDEVRTNAYNNLNKKADYLYEVDYDKLDYEYAKEYFESKAVVTSGMCSAIRSGNYVGRNYDWLDNYDAEFAVRTPNAQGHKAVVGTAGSLSQLSIQEVESREYNEYYKILPFYLQDGVNEDGLFAEMNVVPLPEHPNAVINPDIEAKDRICSLMLVRYILDNFSDVDTAVNYLKNYVQIYNPAALLEMGYEIHYLIADDEKSVVVEFIDGKIKTINQNKSTNFHLYGVNFNADGTVFTNVDAIDGNLPSAQGIEDYGSGLERWNILNAADVEDKDDMRLLMNNLLYTKAYTLRENVWYSEFVGTDITVDTPADSSLFTNRLDVYRQKYEERTKDNPETWLTAHSCVYDLENKKFYITVQETEDEYRFSLNATIDPSEEYATKEYVDSSIENEKDRAETVEAGLANRIDNVEEEIPEVPTNVSAFTNDAGYLTEHQSLEGYATEEYVDGSIDAVRDEIPEVPTNVSAFNNDAGYLTSHQDISGKQDVLVSGTNIKTINNIPILGSGNIDISAGGSNIPYLYLHNIWEMTPHVISYEERRTIPASYFNVDAYDAVVNAIRNKENHSIIISNWYGRYLNIPYTTSIETDTSIEPSEYIAVNVQWGISRAYLCVNRLGEYWCTLVQNFLTNNDLNNYVDNSTFEENNEVISAAINTLIRDKADKNEIPEVPTNVSAFTNDAGYLTEHQDISGKQDVLVSGTNIKTINNIPILGSGNIDISSGSIDPQDLSIYATKEYVDASFFHSVGSFGANDKWVEISFYSKDNQYREKMYLYAATNQFAGIMDASQCAKLENALVPNDISTNVKSNQVANMWAGTQAEYDALSSYDPSTFYIIKAN